MIRKALYQQLVEELFKVEEVKHIDMWNHNVEFIEDETPWDRPAVFVEFEGIQYTPIVRGVEYRVNDLTFRLHVVSDWKGACNHGDELNEEAMSPFDLCEKIHSQLLAGIRDGRFKDLDRVESHTNHNHEDIIDNVEVYKCVVIKSL